MVQYGAINTSLGRVLDVDVSVGSQEFDALNRSFLGFAFEECSCGPLPDQSNTETCIPIELRKLIVKYDSGGQGVPNDYLITSILSITMQRGI